MKYGVVNGGWDALVRSTSDRSRANREAVAEPIWHLRAVQVQFRDCGGSRVSFWQKVELLGLQIKNAAIVDDRGWSVTQAEVRSAGWSPEIIP